MAIVCQGLRVRDVMTPEVATLRQDERLSIADDVMTLGRVRHLPVVDDADPAHVVGIVTRHDLVRGSLARALGIGHAVQQKLLDRIAVKEVMTPNPITIGPDAPLAEAARIMLERKIGCLPVVDAGKLVGILTEGDFVAMALRQVPG
jgi:CBS domain-containing protein